MLGDSGCVDDEGVRHPVSGYYDYTPTVILPRSLAVTGSPASRYREVAYDLAALSGLSLKDLGRWIEHVEGQSTQEITLTDEGSERYLELETTLLLRLLEEQPFGIAVLGPGTLDSEVNADVVRRHATLVYLSHSESILHSSPLQMAVVVVDMEQNSLSEAARILNDALPRLART